MESSQNYISEKVKNASNVTINPSTEEKQDDIILAINSIGANTTGLTPGRKVVAVTNIAVTLGTGACKEVTITALIGNTDVVVIGGSAVVFTLATRTGNAIYPGDSFTVSIDNISKIYINGTAGDGVSFNYTT